MPPLDNRELSPEELAALNPAPSGGPPGGKSADNPPTSALSLGPVAGDVGNAEPAPPFPSTKPAPGYQPREIQPAIPSAATSAPEAPAAPVPEKAPGDIVAQVGPSLDLRGARGSPEQALGDNEHPPVTEKVKLPSDRVTALEKDNPSLHQAIMKASSDVGVPAIDLANLAWASSKFNQNAPGGFMNVSPAEAKQLDPSGSFNPANPVDNVYLGAVKYKQLADRYGVTTSSALGAYTNGADTIEQMSRLSPEDQRKHFPQVFDQLRQLSSPDKGRAVDDTTTAAALKAGGFAGPVAQQTEPQRQEYQPPMPPPSGAPSQATQDVLAGRPTGDEPQYQPGPPRPPEGRLGLELRSLRPEPGAPTDMAQVDAARAAQAAQDQRAADAQPQLRNPLPQYSGQQEPSQATRDILQEHENMPVPDRPGFYSRGRAVSELPRGPQDLPVQVPGPTNDVSGALEMTNPPTDMAQVDRTKVLQSIVDQAAANRARATDPAVSAALGGALPPPERSLADTLPFAPTTGSGPPPTTGTSTPPGAPPVAPGAPAPPTAAPAAPAPPASPTAAPQPTASQLNQQELDRIRSGQPSALPGTQPPTGAPAQPGQPGQPTQLPQPGPGAPTTAGQPQIPTATTPSGAVTQPAGQGPGAGAPVPAVGGPGQTRDVPHVTGSGNLTPQGLITAGAQGGPQGFMRAMVAGAPRGMSTNDMWAHVDTLLEQAFILRGDMVGAQRAREYVFQQQHVGSNQALMDAYRSIAVGDMTGAAQFLAKSHAFVPDGSTMAFKVGPNNTLWGQRFADGSGHQPMGGPFQVTPQGIATMLNQTLDPQQFLKTLNAERSLTQKMTHDMLMTGVRREAIGTTAETADLNRIQRAQTAKEAQDAAAARTQAVVDERRRASEAADARIRELKGVAAGQASSARMNAITKQAEDLYDPTMPGSPAAGMNSDQVAQNKDLFASLRTYNPDIQSGSASTFAKGMLDGSHPLVKMQLPNGKIQYEVRDPSGRRVAYLPPSALHAFGVQE